MPMPTLPVVEIVIRGPLELVKNARGAFVFDPIWNAVSPPLEPGKSHPLFDPSSSSTLPPYTSSLFVGLAVPMPTLPSLGNTLVWAKAGRQRTDDRKQRADFLNTEDVEFTELSC